MGGMPRQVFSWGRARRRLGPRPVGLSRWARQSQAFMRGRTSMKFRLWMLLLFGLVAMPASAQQPSVNVGATDIGGVVTGASGPEAGVWVIAETSDLPTKFARIVVTDDQGRFLIPDLPKANYDVWVRGYGLVDSPKQKSETGKTLNLKASPAPSEKDAAKYYPAIYWYAMMKIPDK